MMATLNQQKLTSKFQAFKGKLKDMNVEKEKVQSKKEPRDKKTGFVDQIRKKYGFSLTGVFINGSSWYLAFYTMMSPYMTHDSKDKVQVCVCKPCLVKPFSIVTIKLATKQTVEIIMNEKCTFVWELRVVGWKVSYNAEYVPHNESNYTIIIQKARNVTPTDEPVISHNFKINELGKILLTIDNPTSEKKSCFTCSRSIPFRNEEHLHFSYLCHANFDFHMLNLYFSFLESVGSSTTIILYFQ